MILLLDCGGNELAHKSEADTRATVVLMDVNRVLNGVLVGRPSAKGAVAGKAKELVGFVDGADNWKPPGGFGFEPRLHTLRSTGVIVVQRGRVGDGLIEYVEDCRGVFIMGAGYEAHGVDDG